MELLTRWVLRHKAIVVVFWAVLAVVGYASLSSLSSHLDKTFKLPGYEGFDTSNKILAIYGNGGQIPPTVPVITLPHGMTVDSPGVRAELTRAFDGISTHVPGVRVADYTSTGNRGFVSADGRTTFALVFEQYVPGLGGASRQTPAITAWLATQTIAGAHFNVTGQTQLATGGSGGGGPGVLTETLVGGLGALIVLAFVFASFLALVPMVVAAIAIPVTFLVIGILARTTDVSVIVQFLVALIGLGVAIDYALLIVTRWREECAAGYDPHTAVERTMQTAGRAVVFSGVTVAIGLLAMVVIPVPFLRSVGYAGMLIPLISVLVALTLLPVFLATFATKVDWPRIRHEDKASPGWTAWARLIVRHKVIAATAGMVILGLCIVPATQVRVGNPTANALGGSGPALAGLNQLTDSGIGPGVLTPFEVLVAGHSPVLVAHQLNSVKGIRTAVAPPGPDWRRAGTSLVEAMPVNDGSTTAAQDTLARVRSVTHRMAGTVRVGGPSALNADFISAVYGSFPLMLSLIALLTFVVLARVFRSLLLPLKAVILNILSVTAALGLMVWVWQEGHGSQQIWGIAPTGAITAFIPLMAFAFLFGLSMDYEVFILSRMREEYDATGSTEQAIEVGIGRTGRLVTSAALILFLAFSSLASGPEVTIKIFATGLAVGILLDATVVRALLVPSLMTLFGKWNWWLPRLPARLLRVEPSLPPGTGPRSEEG